MDSNTSKSRPAWLTDEEIHKMRRRLRECPNPYTDEDIDALELDDPNFSFARANARTAKRLLTKYGIPLTDDDDTTE